MPDKIAMVNSPDLTDKIKRKMLYADQYIAGTNFTYLHFKLSVKIMPANCSFI